MDVQALFRWMADREDAARAEREEQRREDAARFEALLTRLAPLTSQSSSTAGSASAPPDPPVAPPTPRAAVQPTPPLPSDVTYQQFREWRRKWEDYATMVEIASLPRPKQLIQLRMCLSLETQRVLEHTLQVHPSSTSPVDEVLDILQKHIKESSNEALRRRAFTTCKQATGESFADFFVRLKSLSEEIDVCKAHSTECKEAWLKHGILTGVQDEEVMQKIIALDAAATLADVVTLCRSNEATRTAASALRAPPGVRAVSQYRKDKKMDHRTKADARSAVSSPPPSCSNCGKQQHGPKDCPATEAVCHGCGTTGHWSHTEKCPAKTVQCKACSRYGHFEKLCKSSRPKSQHSAKPKPQKSKKNGRATIHVVRTQSPSGVPMSTRQQASSVRRV
ncbi:uncharacterized protein LOC123517192 [Portunus trituberculatus]|uniref:uncharacterized protein LOC123517192 n=1 Tax=Portunus trituberculatus TaxID=210409 RepID=UPI001E1CB7BD|nr:uncharacterized protein LOC123517192 [Portunus trituberculatus]